MPISAAEQNRAALAIANAGDDYLALPTPDPPAAGNKPTPPPPPPPRRRRATT